MDLATISVSVFTSIIAMFILEPFRSWLFYRIPRLFNVNIKIRPVYCPPHVQSIRVNNTHIKNHIVLGVNIWNTRDFMKIQAVNLTIDGSHVAYAEGPYSNYPREATEVANISLSLTDAALSLKHDVRPECKIEVTTRLIINKKLETIKKPLRGNTLKQTINYLNTAREEYATIDT